MLNPLGLVNDGYMELAWMTGDVSAARAIKQFLLPHGT